MARPVGRDIELAMLRAAVENAGSGFPTLFLVDGEAGVGKTTVLTAAAENAAVSGWRCLRTSGLESESTLAYAGLLDLLTPLQERVGELPAPQAAALSAAMGWDVAAGPGERFLVGAAVMRLLAAAAADGPTLVVIDDVQWLDRESVDAVAFAAHRLKHDRVAFMLARRSGTSMPVQLDAAEVLPLAGLGFDAAAAMLKGTVGDPVVRILVEQTAGNPLALLEVSRALTTAQRAGAAALPDAMPVGARLRARYDQELGSLPPSGWRAVLLTAAHRDTNAAPVLAALGADGSDPDQSIAAAGSVLRMADTDLQFRHPLLRSVTMVRASDAERRAAHRDLAAVLPDGPERVRHIAESVAGYDDDLAAAMMAIAESDRARLGYAAAAHAVERAAGLTTEANLRADRLATAVEDAYLAGDADTVRRLSARVLDSSDEAAAQSRVLATLGSLEMFAGSFARARDFLSRSAALGSGRALIRTLTDLGMVCYLLDDRVGTMAAAERAVTAADPDDAEQAMLAEYLIGAAHVVAGRNDVGEPHVRRSIDLLESDPGLRDDPRHLPTALMATWLLRDAGLALPYADRRLDEARARGALGVLAVGLSFMSAGLAFLGQHRRAYAMSGEAVELLDLIGYTSELSSLETLAEESANRGLHDQASQLLARGQQLVARASNDTAPPHLTRVQAFAALCRGDLSTAVSLLEDQVDRWGGIGFFGEPLGVAPDLVEAYLGLGRDDDARRLAQDFAAAQPPDPFPPIAAKVARCAALVADDLDHAVAAYEQALVQHKRMPDTIEQGRTLLHYGMRLRRAGRRVDARERLERARDLFASQDLTLWARRAETEIAGTGRRARRLGTDEPLTSQETRVALLVAEGRTNKEVAAALFLSPKTVEHHLGSVLRKRGLRSRTELARLLAQETAPAEAEQGIPDARG